MKQADTLTGVRPGEGWVSLFTKGAETRLWFMGDGVVRARTSFNGSFNEDSLSLVWTCWPDGYDTFLKGERVVTTAHTPTVEEQPGQVSFTYEEVTVVAHRHPFSLEFVCGGQVQFRDVPGRAYSCSQGRALHSFCMDDSCFYGFGEKTGSLEKTGAALRMSNKDACGYDPIHTDPLYKHVSYFIKLGQSGAACGVYYNHSGECWFDIGREYNGYWPRMGQFGCEGSDLDLFFMAGPSMAGVVRRFTKLTGRPVLAPAYTLGYLGSTMYYSELATGCDKAILGFVDKARREGTPCSDFQLSSGYTTDAGGKRNVFTWNLQKFPDPAAFAKAMEARGVGVTPNIKPAMLLTHPYYEELAQAGAFIRGGDGLPYVTQFWGGEGALFDFSCPEGRNAWQRLLKENLIDQGIRSVWNDNNEFEIFSDEAVCRHEGNPVRAQQIRAELPMLMVMASRKALQEADPARRVYQVTRSGNAGISRYAQTWTGDNCTSWESLQYNIATVLGAGLSGMANTGADVGGFAGPSPEPELFARWVWYGVLQPRFSIHSANNDNTVTEPWMYEELLPVVRSAFKLRRQLQPYLYSLLWEAAGSGAPLMRPMVYEFQHDPACLRQGVDFMLGSALLAACAVQPGQSLRTVYLPQSERFYELWRRVPYEGGQTVELPCPLEAPPPLLLRAGSILPLQQESCLKIIACPGPKVAGFTLYEDDGVSNDYLRGVFLATRFTLSPMGEALELCAHATGSYKKATQPLLYEFQCEARAPRSVCWNGERLEQFWDQQAFEAAPAGWYYHPATRTCLAKQGNGRGLTCLKVDFGYFDLIRM